MADIFVSFSTADTSHVQSLVDGLRARRLSVFWSNDIPKGAPDYHAIIRHELRMAVLVVVVWTRNSIISHPVTQESAQAERADKLFQVLFDDIEPIDFPMEVRFRAQKTLLFGWTGDRQNAEWLKLNAAIDARLAETNESAEHFLRLGMDLCQKGRRQQALAEFNRAIDIDDHFADAYYQRAQCHRSLGDDDAMLKDYQNAVRCYSELIRERPTDARAYVARSRCHYEFMYDEEHAPGIHREFGRSVNDCDKAIELDPQCAAAYVERAELFRRERIYDRALGDLTSAIGIDQNTAGEAYTSRGNLLMRHNLRIISERSTEENLRLIGKWPKQAIEDFSSAIRLNPTICENYIERAFAYSMQEQEEAAVADFSSALRLNYEWTIQITEFHFKWGKRSGRSAFEKAIAGDHLGSQEHHRTGNPAVRQNGTVVDFDEGEGQGWIKPDDQEREIFVEVSAAAESGLGRLQPGMRVSFEAKSRDGLDVEAINLRKPI